MATINLPKLNNFEIVFGDAIYNAVPAYNFNNPQASHLCLADGRINGTGSPVFEIEGYAIFLFDNTYQELGPGGESAVGIFTYCNGENIIFARCGPNSPTDYMASYSGGVPSNGTPPSDIEQYNDPADGLTPFAYGLDFTNNNLEAFVHIETAIPSDQYVLYTVIGGAFTDTGITLDGGAYPELTDNSLFNVTTRHLFDFTSSAGLEALDVTNNVKDDFNFVDLDPSLVNFDTIADTNLGLIFRAYSNDFSLATLILIEHDLSGYREIQFSDDNPFYDHVYNTVCMKLFSGNVYNLFTNEASDNILTGLYTIQGQIPSIDPVPVPIYQPVKLGGQPAPTRKLLGSK